MNSMLYRSVFLAAGVCSASAYAHHSVIAHFDNTREIELRGEVVEFKLRSPHASIVLDGMAYENGEPLSGTSERWEIESDSLPGLRRNGITADSILPGDPLTVAISPHKGSGLNFGHVNGRTLRAALESERVSAALQPELETRELDTLESLWRSRGYPNRDDTPLPLSEDGRAAWESYDPRKSPAGRCESQNIPGVFSPPYLFDLRVNEDVVVLHNEAYGVRREVPLGEAYASPASSGEFGEARATLEDDALIVESRNYPPSGWGLGIATHLNGGGADVPSSDQKTVVERYSLSDDGRTLVLDYTLSDPVYLSRAYDGRFEFVRISEDTPMYPYECDPESAAMFSREANDAPLQIDGE